MKTFFCECGKCNNMLKIISCDDDIDKSDLKENQIEIEILNSESYISIVLNKEELLKELKN